jgi:hypothetical protein
LTSRPLAGGDTDMGGMEELAGGEATGPVLTVALLLIGTRCPSHFTLFLLDAHAPTSSEEAAIASIKTDFLYNFFIYPA